MLAIITVIVFVIFFITPRNITFSYSNSNNCIDSITLLPEIYKQSGNANFKLQPEGGYKIGSIYLFSNKVCIKPTTSPQGGDIKIVQSPFGWSFLQNSYIINVSPRPKASAKLDKPIALTKPLEFTLDKIDNTFTYQIEIDKKIVQCKNEISKISCDIKSLNLKQGEKYSYKLTRIFNNKDTSTAAEGALSLLPPTSVINTSVTNDQIVYYKPKTFSFETNNEIVSAKVILEKIENNVATNIASTIKITGSTIETSISNDLEREVKYRLTLTNAEGKDDSVLEAPYIINFQTSGGPNVTGININEGGVDANAKVVVTFDQTISQTQDISELAFLNGGNATISRTDNQIIFQFHDLQSCNQFSININKGIDSQYNIKSNNNWSYTSRISCGTAEVIGHSVMGRPIIAYYFGSGPTTILFTGGMHGDEYSGSYIMQDWVNYLDTNAYKIPADKRVVIVPSVNPDGLATSERYNANNVNIDRNFAASSWQADIDIGGSILVGAGGPYPMSEPETIALANLTTSLRPRLEVSFHAQGSLVGANQYGDSVDIGLLYAASVGYASMIGHAEEVMGYTITGEFEEWAGEQYGTPAILIELPAMTGRYFWAQQPTLWKMVNI